MQHVLHVKIQPRDFTRQEKTCIRQDVKRFEKIGRDHGCRTLEDYAEFVHERMRYDDQGFLTQKSHELQRGLVAYFGNELLYNTTLIRVAATMQGDHQRSVEIFSAIAQVYPGWLLQDPHSFHHVFIPFIVTDRLRAPAFDIEPLDEICDEIIDWNQGYLSEEDVSTPWVCGPILALEEFPAA